MLARVGTARTGEGYYPNVHECQALLAAGQMGAAALPTIDIDGLAGRELPAGD